jgi:hypothetical protein
VEDTADPLPSLLVAGDSDRSDGEGGATEDSVGDLLRRGVVGVADCVAEEEATGDRAAEDPSEDCGDRGAGEKPRDCSEARGADPVRLDGAGHERFGADPDPDLSTGTRDAVVFC